MWRGNTEDLNHHSDLAFSFVTSVVSIDTTNRGFTVCDTNLIVSIDNITGEGNVQDESLNCFNCSYK